MHGTFLKQMKSFVSGMLLKIWGDLITFITCCDVMVCGDPAEVTFTEAQAGKRLISIHQTVLEDVCLVSASYVKQDTDKVGVLKQWPEWRVSAERAGEAGGEEMGFSSTRRASLWKKRAIHSI